MRWKPWSGGSRSGMSSAAIERLIAERRRDKEFQARLRAMMREDRKILERLAR
jgi:hypothetical protein